MQLATVTTQQRAGIGPAGSICLPGEAASADVGQPGTAQTSAAPSFCAEAAASQLTRGWTASQRDGAAAGGFPLQQVLAASNNAVTAGMLNARPPGKPGCTGGAGSPTQRQHARSDGSRSSDITAAQHADTGYAATSSRCHDNQEQSSAAGDDAAAPQHEQPQHEPNSSGQPQSDQPPLGNCIVADASEAQRSGCSAAAAFDGSDTEADAGHALRTASLAWTEPAPDSVLAAATEAGLCDSPPPTQQPALVSLQRGSAERPAKSALVQHEAASELDGADLGGVQSCPPPQLHETRPTEAAMDKPVAQPDPPPMCYAKPPSPPGFTACSKGGLSAGTSVQAGPVRPCATTVANLHADANAHAAQEQTPLCAGPQQAAALAHALLAPLTQPVSLAAIAAEGCRTELQRRPSGEDQPTSDDGNIEVDDSVAVHWQEADTAADLLVGAAMRKQARQMLAEGAGCSRAVPQHAVAINASLRGLDAAAPSGGWLRISKGPALASRRQVAAACWRKLADDRGCTRAVSRRDIASLAGMLSPAGWVVEAPQVSLKHVPNIETKAGRRVLSDFLMLA